METKKDIKGEYTIEILKENDFLDDFASD